MSLPFDANSASIGRVALRAIKAARDIEVSLRKRRIASDLKPIAKAFRDSRRNRRIAYAVFIPQLEQTGPERIASSRFKRR
jgi:hypothetical protein